MSKTVTIPLSEPIEGHGGLVTSVTVREPRWGDVMGTGAPYTIHRDSEGKPFLVYDEIAVAHYVNACVVEPKDKLILERASLHDALTVRETVVGFFLRATVGANAG